MDRIPLIVLVGPTAVGKTDIAIQLAERMEGEIVSADSRLFYRGMDIGTAKPTYSDRTRIQHHLIDISDPDQILSLAVFQRKAQEAIEDIHRRGKISLLVGGTGQYVRAVTESWTPPKVEPDLRMRVEFEKMEKQRGNLWLHEKLAGLDPEAALKIDSRNVRRTIRALEVIFSTGKTFSGQRKQRASPYRLTTIGLSRPRPELYQRIDERIEAMFTAGFLDEVKVLLDKGYTADLPTMSAIGYRECVKVLEGSMTLDQAKIEMRRATRAFVRRQANWFKETDPKINWFFAGLPNLAEEIETLIHETINA